MRCHPYQVRYITFSYPDSMDERYVDSNNNVQRASEERCKNSVASTQLVRLT